jgi:glucosamine--fructose-6-phosphate aminotransferase (isomerizing)
VGIGTSWHAAHHGAWLLRGAGIDAAALHAADVAPYARRFDAADAVIVLSHTGHTGYTAQALEAARDAGAAVVHVTGVGAGGDVETVVAETSYAYTASHTGALMRLAQMAETLGAGARRPRAVPEAVGGSSTRRAPTSIRPRACSSSSAPAPTRGPPRGGAEDPRGVLRRHRGPVRRAVPAWPERRARWPGHARRARRRRAAAARTEAIAGAMEAIGTRVVRIAERDLGEPLSIFP